MTDRGNNTDMRLPSGFTLIELMMVVAIVSILAMVGYPSYQRWAIEARRSDAHIALTRTAADLEKFFAECSEYASSLTTSRSCTGQGLGYPDMLSPEKYYTLALTVNGASYTISAVPRLAQVNDTNCTSLGINNKGVKSATGAEISRCWRK